MFHSLALMIDEYYINHKFGVILIEDGPTVIQKDYAQMQRDSFECK